MKKFFVILAAIIIPGGLILGVYYFFFRKNNLPSVVGIPTASGGGSSPGSSGSGGLNRILSFIGGTGGGHGGIGGGSSVDLGGLLKAGAGLAKDAYSSVSDWFVTPSDATRAAVDASMQPDFSTQVYNSVDYLRDNLSAPTDFSALNSPDFGSGTQQDFTDNFSGPIGGMNNDFSQPVFVGDQGGNANGGGFSDFGDFGGW